MEAAARAKMAQIDGFSFFRGTANGIEPSKLQATPSSSRSFPQSLVSENEIFRGELSQILFDLTKDNENIKYIL